MSGKTGDKKRKKKNHQNQLLNSTPYIFDINSLWH